MPEYLPQVLPTSNPELLEKAVDTILQKSIAEPAYVQIYVRLICHVSETVSEFERKVKERIVHLVEVSILYTFIFYVLLLYAVFLFIFTSFPVYCCSYVPMY